MSNEFKPLNLADLFGEPISTYSRQQAVDDEVLIDVTHTATEAGFRIAVAITAAAWADCVEWTDIDNDRQTYQDQAGRLWDVLWMAGQAGTPHRRRRDPLSALPSTPRWLRCPTASDDPQGRLWAGGRGRTGGDHHAAGRRLKRLPPLHTYIMPTAPLRKGAGNSTERIRK